MQYRPTPLAVLQRRKQNPSTSLASSSSIGFSAGVQTTSQAGVQPGEQLKSTESPTTEATFSADEDEDPEEEEHVLREIFQKSKTLTCNWSFLRSTNICSKIVVNNVFRICFSIIPAGEEEQSVAKEDRLASGDVQSGRITTNQDTSKDGEVCGKRDTKTFIDLTENDEDNNKEETEQVTINSSFRHLNIS